MRLTELNMNTSRLTHLPGLTLLVILLVAFLPIRSMAQQPGQKAFSSPEAASSALIAATQDNDEKRMIEILGRDAKQIVSSGDELEDAASRATFVQKYKEMHRWVKESAEYAVLYVGGENWPTPIPLLSKGELWYFDTEAGKQEILFRRVGRNEMSAIRVCQELALAQKEYRETHNGEYARQMFSDEGQHNGLFWNSTGLEPPSPIGPLVAAAAAKGHNVRLAGEAVPFRGYYFELITRQGKNAPNGAKDYIVNGKMTGGFAFLAYPAEYGSSGVMTFIVSEDGVVRQKDLGRKTDVADKFIKTFNPDASWKETQVFEEIVENEMPK
jgi:hypothetical protein